MQTALEQELAQKVTLMSRHGVGRLLGAIHPRINKMDHTLIVGTPSGNEMDIRDRDLVLTPLASDFTGLAFQADKSNNVVLYYPARGIGGAGPQPNGLARALGSVRTTVLADLDVGRSTNELVTRHGYSPATISYHLHALHQAGLVTKRREGRFVIYSRAEHATTLLRNA